MPQKKSMSAPVGSGMRMVAAHKQPSVEESELADGTEGMLGLLRQGKMLPAQKFVGQQMGPVSDPQSQLGQLMGVGKLVGGLMPPTPMLHTTGREGQPMEIPLHGLTPMGMGTVGRVPGSLEEIEQAAQIAKFRQTQALRAEQESLANGIGQRMVGEGIVEPSAEDILRARTEGMITPEAYNEFLAKKAAGEGGADAGLAEWAQGKKPVASKLLSGKRMQLKPPVKP